MMSIEIGIHLPPIVQLDKIEKGCAVLVYKLCAAFTMKHLKTDYDMWLLEDDDMATHSLITSNNSNNITLTLGCCVEQCYDYYHYQYFYSYYY